MSENAISQIRYKKLNMQIKKRAYAKLLAGLDQILEGFEQGVLEENVTDEPAKPVHNEGMD